jgi:hypothetical protein
MAQTKVLDQTEGVELKLLGAVEEGQPDGSAPPVEEGLLLPLLAADQHTLVAAKRAEPHELAAPPPEEVHALVA